MQWLTEQRPDLLPRYEQLYRRGAYAPVEERKRLAALVRRGAPGPFRRVAQRVLEDHRPEPPIELRDGAAPAQERLF
jgi:hypothetical protein